MKSKDSSSLHELSCTDPKKGNGLPSSGGSYVREKDGTLKKVGGTENISPFGNVKKMAKEKKAREAAVASAAKKSEATTTDSTEETDQNGPLEDPDFLDMLVVAIGEVSTKDRSLWTKKDGPLVSTLEKTIEGPVTEQQRNLAWAAFQKSQEN